MDNRETQRHNWNNDKDVRWPFCGLWFTNQCYNGDINPGSIYIHMIKQSLYFVEMSRYKEQMKWTIRHTSLQ